MIDWVLLIIILTSDGMSVTGHQGDWTMSQCFVHREMYVADLRHPQQNFQAVCIQRNKETLIDMDDLEEDA